MTGVKHNGFTPVFHFHETKKSISKTEKWKLPDEIYKKTGEFSNCGSRHDNPKLTLYVAWPGETYNGWGF
ncbi:MAG: hypothetical protein KJP23_00225 [Deltaproteobacteria bacterium]|nr:hypothetical protein [Deltaproteobacteria bacterium]